MGANSEIFLPIIQLIVITVVNLQSGNISNQKTMDAQTSGVNSSTHCNIRFYVAVMAEVPSEFRNSGVILVVQKDDVAAFEGQFSHN